MCYHAAQDQHSHHEYDVFARAPVERLDLLERPVETQARVETASGQLDQEPEAELLWPVTLSPLEAARQELALVHVGDDGSCEDCSEDEHGDGQDSEVDLHDRHGDTPFVGGEWAKCPVAEKSQGTTEYVLYSKVV